MMIPSYCRPSPAAAGSNWGSQVFFLSLWTEPHWGLRIGDFSFAIFSMKGGFPLSTDHRLTLMKSLCARRLSLATVSDGLVRSSHQPSRAEIQRLLWSGTELVLPDGSPPGRAAVRSAGGIAWPGVASHQTRGFPLFHSSGGPRRLLTQ